MPSKETQSAGKNADTAMDGKNSLDADGGAAVDAPSAASGPPYGKQKTSTSVKGATPAGKIVKQAPKKELVSKKTKFCHLVMAMYRTAEVQKLQMAKINTLLDDQIKALKAMREVTEALVLEQEKHHAEVDDVRRRLLKLNENRVAALAEFSKDGAGKSEQDKV